MYNIPDVSPPDQIPKWVDFSMVAGEFVMGYKDQLESWDIVATCFFIDTANNIVEYIEVIYNI